MAHGPANPNGHRRSIVTIGGRAAVVQRYGIDYFKVDSAGHTFSGDSAKKEDYYGYGQDVLAVADGIIAVASNEVPDNPSPHPSKRAVPINLKTIGGNYVMLDIGSGRYVFYAHLKPNSIRVKQGDKVRRGQVLGLARPLGEHAVAPPARAPRRHDRADRERRAAVSCTTRSTWSARAPPRP